MDLTSYANVRTTLLQILRCTKYGVFSGPYFPVFGLNTGKYGPEETRIWTISTLCYI